MVAQGIRVRSACPRLADVRRVAVAVALLLLVARGQAQVQGYPVDPSATIPAAGPLVAERVIPGLPPMAGPVPDALPPPAAALSPSCGPAASCPLPVPGGPPPCPDPFRCGTPGGGTVTGFPRTLLWEPPLASLREPRFLVMPTTLSNGSTKQTVDTAIGNTVGLLRWEPARCPAVTQLDFFAVVDSRFSQYNYLVATDYRFGFPVTFALGPWHAKIGYEHTSTHLGDETLVRTGQVPFDYIKDELVLAAGRYLFDRRLRPYALAAWAFNQQIPGNPSPFRFALGAEWVGARETGCWGRPFAATNLDFNGAVDYKPSFSLQGGWIWRDPGRRLAECRVFGQYFTGYSPYGQFFQSRENWFGLGFAFDY